MAIHGGVIWYHSDRVDRIFYHLFAFFTQFPIPNSLTPFTKLEDKDCSASYCSGIWCQSDLCGSYSNHMSTLLMLLFTVVPIFFFPLYSPSWRTRTDWRTTVESDVNLRSIQRPLRRSASQRPSSTKKISLGSSN